MNTPVEISLNKAAEHLGRNRVNEAEYLIRSVLDSLDRQSLAAIESQLRELISGFMPKRRRDLNAALEGALSRPESARKPAPTDASVVGWTSLSALGNAYRADLSKLSVAHIFQWSTFYRE